MLTETLVLTSPVQLGSTDVALCWGSGAPDGDASPWVDAVKGSVYLRLDATDEESPIYVKIDDEDSDDDWVAVLIDAEAASRTFNASFMMVAGKKVLFRDTDLFIYSPVDGKVRIGFDGQCLIGDGTNQAAFEPDGELRLEGTAKVTRTVPLALDVEHGTATAEEFKGAPSINLDADGEEWFASFEAPNDWDEASDLTIVFMVANEIAETDGDDVSFTLQVRGYADGETVADAGQAVAATLNLTGGDEAIDVVNRVTGTIDYDHGTYPIAAGDMVVVKAAVNLAGGGECTGPLHVIAQWVEYTANKLGTAT